MPSKDLARLSPESRLKRLLEAERKGKRPKYVLFWGHTAPPNGAIGPHVLSQWWPASFEVERVRYKSAEQFMMASKAALFGDHRVSGLILRAKGPQQAKGLGRQVRGFDEQRWSDHRYSLVITGNLAKFSQNPDLRAYLLGTGDRVLVEASPVDRIWGIGLSRDDPRAGKPSLWRGKNLLGFALMEVRERLSELAILKGRRPDRAS
ncbi:MAG: NADAR family protein [Chloroflexi bacterium]|nr:MAG: NADAR family protein [Chloroflexota bacterium]